MRASKSENINVNIKTLKKIFALDYHGSFYETKQKKQQQPAKLFVSDQFETSNGTDNIRKSLNTLAVLLFAVRFDSIRDCGKLINI